VSGVTPGCLVPFPARGTDIKFHPSISSRLAAIETLERVLKYDPGNETARGAIADAKAQAKE
jgi:hypothetical protein